ncbi:hypothetical protein K432DRAFT_470244 [Lepidopterella palustris CBS 459.81]|uniref:Uncharacterized protein n=1 Tax=Lepidopterella palustris CBS 459.81 TaxID=1314670 RepID=A0A8E2JA21_9PEZI|nr:hypothetical protein K432DRAFT_470244 [Lepidopterella palustris CBS 459.81]
MGYRYADSAEKLALAGLTPQDSELVDPKRIKGYPVQMECELVTVCHTMADLALAVGIRVLRVCGAVVEGRRA